MSAAVSNRSGYPKNFILPKGFIPEVEKLEFEGYWKPWDRDTIRVVCTRATEASLVALAILSNQ